MAGNIIRMSIEKSNITEKDIVLILDYLYDKKYIEREVKYKEIITGLQQFFFIKKSDLKFKKDKI